ncbi:hypothetical protein ACFO5K_00950 [Nocardia halotolerans]|uniref:Carboxypeptidase regulatory-like domain-containing protein n=1 Tax=Nocardia halotolerans TaxID=1755878 RepID=A0ABV8V9T9_9NOCA
MRSVRGALVIVGIALGLATAACTDPDLGSTAATGSPTTQPWMPPDATGPTPAPDPGVPIDDHEPWAQTVIRTKTTTGTPVGSVIVHAVRFAPCDGTGPQSGFPADAKPTGQYDLSTNDRGELYTELPFGCYKYTLSPPGDAVPVDTAARSFFLLDRDKANTVVIQFEDQAQPTDCDPTTVANTLTDRLDYLADVPARVQSCAGEWALIDWPTSPGDNLRLIRTDGSSWTTYTAFPHSICWAQAEADWVPSRFSHYFENC